jgi:hypothetical protein
MFERRRLLGEAGCAVRDVSLVSITRTCNTGRCVYMQLAFTARPSGAHSGLVSSCRVATEGYWSPVGYKVAFFACATDARGQPQCLDGTSSPNESLTVVNNCSKVRASPL